MPSVDEPRVTDLALARRGVDALKVYRHHDTPLTPEQAQVLHRWPGWGALAGAFDARAATATWGALRAELEDLLSPGEFRSAQQQVDVSFNTPPPVTRAVWRLLQGLGFTGGDVLDIGAGHGAFVQAMPAGLGARYTGVEPEAVSAGIARLLHPTATLIEAEVQQTAIRVDQFGAVVGNVPFSKGTVYDPTWPDDAGQSKLHNYCLWRGLQGLHPGGLQVVVTSRFTLDSTEDEATRATLSRMGELVGAIRLPSGTFPGAGVVADILVIRRHGVAQGQAAGWPQAYRHAAFDTTLSRYWDDHPELVLGRMTSRSGYAAGRLLDVRPQPGGPDLSTALDRAVDRLLADAAARGITYLPPVDEAERARAALVELAADVPQEGVYAIAADSTVTQVVDGKPVPVATASGELRSLILLAEAALDLYELEADADRPDGDIEPTRVHVRRLYDAYVATWGHLSRSTLIEGLSDSETGLPTYARRRPSMGGFRVDPRLWVLLGLEEEWDDRAQTAAPAQILSRRVNRRAARVLSTSDPVEAISLCLDQRGRFDLDHAAALLGMDRDAAAGHLSGHGLIFCDPDGGEWETADAYLSGNVREKLERAQRAASVDPWWQPNVDALTAVQPRPLQPEEILARLGAPWVPADVVARFVFELLEQVGGKSRVRNPVSVRHEPRTATWEVSAAPLRARAVATTLYGTARVNGVDLIQHALNSSAPVVYDTVLVPDGHGGSRERRVRNEAETQLADARMKTIQEEFGAWLWRDPDRTDRMVARYNRAHNAIRLRTYDGSALTFPGLTGITLYQHQRDMVARILQSEAAECGHAVGAGKTPIQICAAMKLKQLGLANKPCLIVPRHVLEQTGGTARRLYPAARILVVTKQDLTPQRRRLFASRVISTDWDLIIMTHQQFTSIPVGTAAQAEWVADQIELLEQAIAGPDMQDKNCRTAKRLARQVRSLRERHAALTDRVTDPILTFEMLGIDCLGVDEFQYFKNLACYTRMDGFSMPASKRAEDLFIKQAWLRRRNPGGHHLGHHLYGYTGTPISNTLAESYTLLRYFAPHRLVEQKIESFDGFAGLHIAYVNRIEVAPDGSGFRMHRRPGQFINVPELRLLIGECVEVRSRRSLNLGGPAVLLEDRVTAAPPEMGPFIDDLIRRSDLIRRGVVKPGVDNMLAVCNDGRKASLDLRLVGITPTAPDKIDDAIAHIARLYHQRAGDMHPAPGSGALFDLDGPRGGLQLVFCDLGTPDGNDDRVYGRIRSGIIAAGVDPRHIAYSHDARNPEQERELDARANDGRVQVLLTSTAKGGTGKNWQRIMHAIHHLDPTWRPDEYEQRNGRGDRPGNLHGQIRIIRYLAEGSFDAYMWQGLERKAAFIADLLSDELNARVIDDVLAEQVLDFGHLKALSTGHDLLRELAQVEADLARLANEHAGHMRDQGRMRAQSTTAAMTRGVRQHEVEAWGRMHAALTGAKAPARTLTNHRGGHDERAAAGQVAAVATSMRTLKSTQRLGVWRGVIMALSLDWNGDRPAPTVLLTAPSHHLRVEVPIPAAYLTPDHAHGLLAHIDQVLGQAEWRANAARLQSDLLAAKIAEIEPLLGQPFAHQQELDAARRRRDEIQAQMWAQVEDHMTPRDDAELIAA